MTPSVRDGVRLRVADGRTVSTKKSKASDCSGLLPPTGVAMMLIECDPSESSEPGGIAMVQLPLASALVLPMDICPSRSWTLLLGATFPVKVGVEVLRVSLLPSGASIVRA